MKPKRILMISYHTCPLASKEGKETGGMNIYVYELSKSLAKLGYQVDAITRCQDKNNKKIVEVQKNFRVIHLEAGPHGHIRKKDLINYIPKFINSFKAFITEENINYDLIHAHYYQSGLIAKEIKKSLPLIMTFHTVALLKNLVARSTQELEDNLRIETEFDLMKTSNAIIAPSLTGRQYLKYLYNVPQEKIFEIPPGVNTDLFKPINKLEAKKCIGLKDEEKIILFVGRIEPLKGIDVLFYALKILLSQLPNIPLRLVIVGGDVSQHITKWSPQLRQLEKLRHTLGISSHVDFVGQQTQAKLPCYYSASEVTVMPSHYESFGIAAAESMACGTPVITTNVTGVSNLIDFERSKLITSVNNPLLLASQIKFLLKSEKLYKQIRKNIMENVQDLKWDLIAKKMSSVYQRFI